MTRAPTPASAAETLFRYSFSRSIASIPESFAETRITKAPAGVTTL